VASARPIDGLTAKTFKLKALRFLRWRAEIPKAKPRFVKYWRTR
jgi:hypothetical protein